MTKTKVLASALLLAGLSYLFWGQGFAQRYEATVPRETIPALTHMYTPEPLRAVYVTSYVAGLPKWRERILKLIDDTELDAIVIDIKDYTGVLVSARAPDIAGFIKELHEHHVYVIGRLSVFQDQKFVKERPDLAVKRKDNAEVWRDRKGIAWLDPGAQEVWDYIVKIAEDAYYKQGFDEINFDYIRFPSDGDMENVVYTFAATTTKATVMKNFYMYVDGKLRGRGIPISADLFGLTTIRTDDMGIGQVLENALHHFDYVCPMVYPSHYPPTFNGWPDPNKVPGEVVNFSLIKATARAAAASSSPDKIRPWLQDFDYGGNYGESEVRAQKNAVYDAGLTSWMLWDPSVKYTPAALDKVSTST